MRIISGKHRGTNLFLPPDDLIRPTSDRAKEMIFSTLNSIILKKKLKFDDMKVLDFFCGAGGLGIECISRGFKKVISYKSLLKIPIIFIPKKVNTIYIYYSKIL